MVLRVCVGRTVSPSSARHNGADGVRTPEVLGERLTTSAAAVSAGGSVVEVAAMKSRRICSAGLEVSSSGNAAGNP